MFSHVIRSDTVEIDAPIELVWDVLTDIARYGEWNPFTTCRDSELKVGLPVHLDVRLGLYRREQTEWVRDLEPPNLLSWGMHMGAPFLLDSLREQRLTALSETPVHLLQHRRPRWMAHTAGGDFIRGDCAARFQRCWQRPEAAGGGQVR